MIRHDDDDLAVLPKFNLQPTPPPFSFSLFVTLFILGPTEERERERERERDALLDEFATYSSYCAFNTRNVSPC